MADSEYLSFFEKVGIVPPKTSKAQIKLFHYIFAAKGVNGNDDEFWKRVERVRQLQARYINRIVEVQIGHGVCKGTIIMVHPNLTPMSFTVTFDNGKTKNFNYFSLTFLG